MTVLFLGNTPADVGLSPSVVSTLTTGRDSAYSPSSLLCNGIVPVVNIPADSGTTFWFHLRMFMNGVSTGSGTTSIPVFKCFDASSNLIFDVLKVVNSYESSLRVYGSTTVTGPSYNFLNNQTYFIDFKVTVGPSGGTTTVEMFINGVLVSWGSVTNSGTVRTQPRQLQIDFPMKLQTGNLNFSEFIATSDEPTIGMRLSTLEPASAGAFSDWSGSVASLADNDSASGVTSTLSNQKFTSIFSAYAGSSIPAGVRGLFLKANASQSGVAPTRLDQPVRISGTNYNGTAETVVTGTPQMRELDVNPASSLPWSVSAFAALEAGVRSVA